MYLFTGMYICATFAVKNMSYIVCLFVCLFACLFVCFFCLVLLFSLLFFFVSVVWVVWMLMCLSVCLLLLFVSFFLVVSNNVYVFLLQYSYYLLICFICLNIYLFLWFLLVCWLSVCLFICLFVPLCASLFASLFRSFCHSFFYIYVQGGMRGVIWGDTVQSVVMLAGMVAVLIQGTNMVTFYFVSHQPDKIYVICEINKDNSKRPYIVTLDLKGCTCHFENCGRYTLWYQRRRYIQFPTSCNVNKWHWHLWNVLCWKLILSNNWFCEVFIIYKNSYDVFTLSCRLR